MTVVINGTSGITDVNGTAAAPAITGTDTDTGVFFGTNTVSLSTGGTERLQVDSSGNLGIGVTPNTWRTNDKAIQVGGSTDYSNIVGSGAGIAFGNNFYRDSGGFKYKNSYTAGRFDFDYTVGGGFAWNIAPSGTAGNAITFTQAMTLDSSGNLLVGTTSTLLSAGIGVKIQPAGYATTPTVSCVGSSSSNTADTYHVYSTGAAAFRFYVGYGGTISATSTSITGLSDVSLKENIRDLETGLSEVLNLKPRRFDWKAETEISEKNVAGFIAQEVEEVLPELVYEYKYSAEETKKSLKMGDILPTLVKAIQEQQAIITQLQADVAALKAKA